MNSADYSEGYHTVTVEATDGVGRRSPSQSFMLDIERDTTDPQLEVSGPLEAAPEGWVDQHSYDVTAAAQDAGYGVTNVKLLIDGQQVGQAVTQPCPDGGCPLTHTFTVDTGDYSGGAHTVDLVATDGGGNSTTNSWTMNVNPEGTIGTGEAIDTLEAAGATSDTPTVEVGEADSEYPGTSADIGVEQVGSSIESTGTGAPSSLTTEPSDGVTLQVPNPAGFGTADPVEEPTEDGTIPEAIQIAPADLGPDSTGAAVTTTGAAVVAANTLNQVDTVTRPLYDGNMTFALIRDGNASEQYSWRLDMEPDYALSQIDPRNVQVNYPDGTPALTIVAIPAHDATGATVPTSLSVDAQNGFTLTVSHRNSGFVYPILAGPGWEAAYSYAPPWGWPEDWIWPDLEGGWQDTFGAPEPDTSDPLYRANGCHTSRPSGPCPQKRRYNFVRCGRGGFEPPINRAATPCASDSIGSGGRVLWRLNVHGHFRYLFGQWVKVWPGEYHCSTSGPSNLAASGPCPPGNYKLGSQGAYYQDGGRKLWMFGEFAVDAEGDSFHPACWKIAGFLPSRPSDSGPFPGSSQNDWSRSRIWRPNGGNHVPPGTVEQRCGPISTTLEGMG